MIRTIAAVTIVAAMAAPAWAGRNQADELLSTQPSTQEQLARSQPCPNPDSPQAEHQRQEVRSLLNRLEAGQKVSPAEIERVLRQSINQP